MQEWLLQLWSDFNKTVVFVTHDVEESIFLSDEVHVMAARPGRIVETIPVALPRPRLRACTTTPDFMLLKERCLDLLHSQAQSSIEDAA
jgi:ABC-type nitrate/sulfonate/bicarbonate transport system ATPase subunit